MRRILPTVLASLLLIGLAAVFQVARRYDPAAARLAEGLPGESTLSAHEAVMVARYRGEPQWRLHVKDIRLLRSPESDLADFHTAEFDTVSEGVVFQDARRRATFDADSATYQKALRRLEVRGGLSLRSVEGDTFRSERCVWTEDDDFIRFPKGASAAIQGDTVTAPDMLYSTRLRLVQCPQGAGAVFRSQPIVAGSLEWDVEARRIRCDGTVSGSRGDLTFRAESAELDLQNRTIRVNKGTVDLRMDSQ